jgi:AraC-like DNA-binding protein
MLYKYGFGGDDKEDVPLAGWFDNFLNYVDNHIDERIPLDLLARHAGVNKFQFIRLFKKQLGLAPVEFILQRKVQAAKHKLKNGTSLVSAALDTGFYDQSHFSNYFKRYVGVTPLAYQKGCNILQD